MCWKILRMRLYWHEHNTLKGSVAMENLVQSFIDVKTRISGNREKRAYEYTFGTPIETQHDITPVSYTHLDVYKRQGAAVARCRAVGISL